MLCRFRRSLLCERYFCYQRLGDYLRKSPQRFIWLLSIQTYLCKAEILSMGLSFPPLVSSTQCLSSKFYLLSTLLSSFSFSISTNRSLSYTWNSLSLENIHSSSFLNSSSISCYRSVIETSLMLLDPVSKALRILMLTFWRMRSSLSSTSRRMSQTNWQDSQPDLKEMSRAVELCWCWLRLVSAGGRECRYD